ncbi:hypothetical protein D9M73_271580 [compost metagenome]
MFLTLRLKDRPAHIKPRRRLVLFMLQRFALSVLFDALKPHRIILLQLTVVILRNRNFAPAHNTITA